MTYISRKTRIIVSRWLNECDTEYALQASRKRSDGRLKRYSSCDDLRAWANNNCIKHEHLLDLMSDGEVTGKSRIRLFGRIIPVPVLVQILQNAREINERKLKEVKQQQTSEHLSENITVGVKLANDGDSGELNSDEGSLPARKNSSLVRVQYEKLLLEKRLFECTNLLNRALGKLEKIDTIACLSNDESENMRNFEIQEAFSKSKSVCCCSPASRANSETLTTTKSCIKKFKDSKKCKELRRKISELQEKLKKIQECRCEINEKIRTSQKRALKSLSSPKITELYSRREQAHTQKLQKDLEKLTAEEGRLVSEMCQAVNCFNSLKKSSRNSLSWKKSSRTNVKEVQLYSGEIGGSVSCSCGCQYLENVERLKSDKNTPSDSFSSEDSYNNEGCDDRPREDPNNYGYSSRSYRPSSPVNYNQKRPNDSRNMNSEFYNDKQDNRGNPKPSHNLRESKTTILHKPKVSIASSPEYLKSDSQKNKNLSPDRNEQNNSSFSQKKSSRKYVCPEEPCKRPYFDDLSQYPNTISPEHQAVLKGLEQLSRLPSPQSSNVHRTNSSQRVSGSSVRRERSDYQLKYTSSNNPVENIPERRIKSETTMKEIEKALRNYEERLNNMECLEYKIEDMKQKVSDANQLRRQWAQQKVEEKKLRAADKEKSKKEITKLYLENWELKKEIEQLTFKFESQNQKVESLKCCVEKVREAECKAEELKKELFDSRDAFERQRKCSLNLERVIAMQRIEIKNLTSQLRMLAAMKDSTSYSPCQDRRYIQRSRSYSPEPQRGQRGQKLKNQSRAIRMSSDEEETGYCCEQCRLEDNERMNRTELVECNYCPPASNKRVEWCMN